MEHDPDFGLPECLAALLEVPLSQISAALAESPANVKVILSRQLGARSRQSQESASLRDRPVCRILGKVN